MPSSAMSSSRPRKATGGTELKREDSTTRDAPELSALEAILWLLLWGVAVLLYSNHDNMRPLLISIGGVSTLLSLRGFYVLGGPVITGAAAFCLGHSLMVGFAGIYIGLNGYEGLPPALAVKALNILLGSLWLLIFIFWSPGRRERLDRGEAPSGAGLFAPAALLTVGGTVAMRQLGSGSDYSVEIDYLIAEGTQAAGFVCLAAWAAGRFRSHLPSLLVAGGALAIAFAGHSGGGRLRIAVLACAMAAAISRIRRSYAPKMLTILGTPPLLAIAAQARLDYVRERGGAPDGTGLESLISPLYAFARIWDAESAGALSHRAGKSFLTPIQVVLPDFMPGVRPFGYEIARTTRPYVTNPEYSEAGHILGEFVYNFGGLGVIVGTIALGVSLRVLLDRNPVRGWFPQTAPWIALWALGVGTVIEMEWGGLHTAALRFGTRSAVLVMTLFAFHLLGSLLPSKSGQSTLDERYH